MSYRPKDGDLCMWKGEEDSPASGLWLHFKWYDPKKGEDTLVNICFSDINNKPNKELKSLYQTRGSSKNKGGWILVCNIYDLLENLSR